MLQCRTHHPKIHSLVKWDFLFSQLFEQIGIAINPSEAVEYFGKYLYQVDKVLIMGVYPGKGGQVFIKDVLSKIDDLQGFNFEIGVDGGINEETVKLVKNVDYIVSGSFVCCSNDFNKQIDILKL